MASLPNRPVLGTVRAMRTCVYLIVASACFVFAAVARAEVGWQLGEGDAPTILRITLTPVVRADVAPLVTAGTQDGNAAPLYREAVREL